MSNFSLRCFAASKTNFLFSLHLLNPLPQHTVCSQIMRGAQRYVVCVRWCYLWEFTLDSLKNYITLPKLSSAWKQRSMYRDIHRATLIWCIHLQHTLNALKVYYLTKYKNIFESVSFLKTELAQVVEIIPHEKPVPIYPAHSVLLLLLSWRCREPGQPKPWFGQLVWNRVKVVTRTTPIKERLGRHAKYYSEINRVWIIVWSWCRAKYYFVIIEQCWLEYLKHLTKIRTNVSKWHPEWHQHWFLYVIFCCCTKLCHCLKHCWVIITESLITILKLGGWNTPNPYRVAQMPIWTGWYKSLAT